ncbi:MAG TPA: tetratricopeptide repeat protein [Pirellulaceae bacterium]|jgi:hypothetical protein|nr:tetratricopeptide repeat protein [Pirellulaceae bacterium]
MRRTSFAQTTSLASALSLALLVNSTAVAQVRLAPPVPPAPTAERSAGSPDGSEGGSARSADPPTDLAELERSAVAAIRAGDAVRGEAALRKLLSIEPNNREAVVALGNLLLNVRPHEAAPFLAPYAQTFPNDAEIQQLYARSMNPLDGSAIDIGRESSRVGGSVCDCCDCPSRLYGSLRITERYDDFPGVVPTANVFGGPTNRTNSFGNLAAAQINYDLIRLDDFTLTGGYDGIYTHYYEPSSSRFDILQHAGYLAATKKGYTPLRDLPFAMTLRGDYDNVSADQDPFLQRYGASWGMTVQDSERTSATLLLRYTNYDFLSRSGALLPSLFATPGDPDSDDYAIGVTRRWESCLVDGLIWEAGYFFDRNIADSPQFTYSGNRLLGGATVALPRGGTLGTNVTYYRRDYDNSAGGYRADDELLLGVRYLKPLWRDDVLFVAEYAYDLNQSTVAANQYDRNVFDVGLQWNFGR